MGEARNPPPPGPKRGSDPLMARIDRSLADWPATPARGADDDRAAAIAARATAGGELEAGDVDALAPPLPRARDEGGGKHRRPAIWLVSGAVAAAAIAAAVGVVATRAVVPGEATALPAGGRGNAAPVASSARPAGTTARAPEAIDVPGVDPSLLPLASAGGGSPPAPPAAGPRIVLAGRPTGGSPGAAQPSSAGSAAAAGADESLVPAAAIAPGSSLGSGPWSVPRRPSIGAVQGAFGAVLPGARACLAPGAPPLHATVTFQSDGTVRDVALPDADPPGGASAASAACVRSALAKASVPPFAEGAYAAPVTVRGP
jgi:hypothetical protein